MLTVREYVEGRSSFLYGKKIRILEGSSKKYLGEWQDYNTSIVLGVKVTTKYVFIFI
jgi:hypothetical protein